MSRPTRPLRPAFLENLFGLRLASLEIDAFFQALSTPSNASGIAFPSDNRPQYLPGPYAPAAPSLALETDAKETKPITCDLTGDIKVFSDSTFVNYFPLGLSLLFAPPPGTEDYADGALRTLSRVDIYNPAPPPSAPSASSSSAPSSAPSTSPSASNSASTSARPRRRKPPTPTYAPPAFPLTFHLPSDRIQLPPSKPGEAPRDVNRPDRLDVRAGTTGREFVECFGEPSRKGGGGDGWVPVWMEWGGVELVAEDGEGQIATRRGGSSSAEGGGRLEVDTERTELKEERGDGEGDAEGDGAGGGEGGGEDAHTSSENGGMQSMTTMNPPYSSPTRTNYHDGSQIAKPPSASHDPPARNILSARPRTVVLGIMVELRDPGADEVLSEEQKRKGAGGIWDRAAGWSWSGMKIFPPGGD